MEENPFEIEEGARLWIKSVENEKGEIRDQYFYPLLSEWLKDPSVHSVLDIGGGQGVASQFCKDKVYTNVEPSSFLVERAKEIYGSNRNHVVGNAYDLPFSSNTFDAAFSITVWFHLKDLDKAAQEMFRVLKPGGKFLIINPSPNSYDVWRTFYSDVEDINEKTFVGKASVPHAILPRNTFFKHTQQELLKSFADAGLEIEETKEFAPMSARFGGVDKDEYLFTYYKGYKNSLFTLVTSSY